MNITQHAYQRARERFRWKPETLERMAKRAVKKGETVDDVTGLAKFHVGKHGKESRLYGHIVYVIKDEKLITLMPVNERVL